QDAAAKAKLKVEKLRKRLEKEERRIAKSEAKSLKRSKVEADEEPIPQAKRLKREASPDGNKSVPFVTALGASNDPDERSKNNTEADTSNPIPDPLTPTSQPALPDSEIKLSFKLDQPSSDSKTPQPAITNGDAHQAVTNSERHHNGNVNSTLSTDTTSVSSDETLEDDNEDDDTSSSGSSSSSSEPDAEGPEPVSSRSKGPQKVRPPKRVDKQEKAVCRDFLKTGRCRRGKRCRWRHALPERGRRKQEEETPFRVERKSLHQRLVEQELEKERQEKAKLEQHDHQTQHDTPTTVDVPSTLKLSMQDRIHLQRQMQQTAITRKDAIKFHFNVVFVLIILRIIPRIIHHLRHLSIQAMKTRIIGPSWFIGIQKADDA
ncbi:MAG: hypothetical protein Q9180_008055, partial [Flavoplaca navasiana]